MIRFLFAALVVIQLALVIVFYPQISSTLGYRATAPQLNVNSNSLSLLRSGELEIPPSVEVTTNRVGSQQCREIGDFAAKESAQAIVAWLKARGAAGRMDTKVTISEQNFRVYVGDFNEEDEAAFAQRVIQQRNNELKNATIYQSQDYWRVAFGEFTDMDQATAFKYELERMIEGLRVSVETRLQTKTGTTLRYLEKDAQRLGELAADKEFVRLLKAYSVTLSSCS